MSGVIKPLTRSTTDLNFQRSFSFERSQVIAPVVKLKYDVPMSPQPPQTRQKRKVILQVPVEQKISHRYSLRLFKSNTCLQENSDCTVSGDGHKITGVGFGKTCDPDTKRNKTPQKCMDGERLVKSANDNKQTDRSKY